MQAVPHALPDGIGISVVSPWASLEPECVFALLESRLPERGDICTGVSDSISALRHHPRCWGLEIYEFCLTGLKRHAGVVLRAAGSCDAFDEARSKDDEKPKSVISMHRFAFVSAGASLGTPPVHMTSVTLRK